MQIGSRYGTVYLSKHLLEIISSWGDPFSLRSLFSMPHATCGDSHNSILFSTSNKPLSSFYENWTLLTIWMRKGLLILTVTARANNHPQKKRVIRWEYLYFTTYDYNLKNLAWRVSCIANGVHCIPFYVPCTCPTNANWHAYVFYLVLLSFCAWEMSTLPRSSYFQLHFILL